MQRSAYSIEWESWAEDSSRSENSQKQRRILLKLWSQANNRSVDRLVDEIISDKITIYESSRRFLDGLRKSGHKPSTINVYRSLLSPFFQSVFGSQNFDQQAFDLIVPRGDSYPSTVKKAPTPQQVRAMVEIGNVRDKVLIGLLCSGMRVGEALSRRLDDLTVREAGYGVMRLQARATKRRRRRFVFLTSEAVEWINQYHTNLRGRGSKSWILLGELGNHLSVESGYVIVKELFEKIGLIDSEEEIYSPHSFRVFASSLLRRCGLNESWTDAIVGQMSRLGAKSAYLDWQEIEESWFEKVHDHLLLESKPAIENRIRELQSQIAELEKLKV